MVCTQNCHRNHLDQYCLFLFVRVFITFSLDDPVMIDFKHGQKWKKKKCMDELFSIRSNNMPLEQCYPNLSWRTPSPAHFVCLPYKTLNSWLFLNMRSCLYLCSCGLVKRHQSSPKYCSNSKFTSSQVQLKSPDVSLLRPFYQGCIRGDLCELEAARYPRMHFAPISER